MIIVCLDSEWPVPGVQIVNTGAKWRAEEKKQNHLAVISWSRWFAPSLNAWKRPGSEIRESRERARASLYWLLKLTNETETTLYQMSFVTPVKCYLKVHTLEGIMFKAQTFHFCTYYLSVDRRRNWPGHLLANQLVPALRNQTKLKEEWEELSMKKTPSK